MNVLRPMGSLRSSGRGSNGIVIKEGVVNHHRIAPVKGKGKSMLVENVVGKDIIGGGMNPGAAILESSATDDLILRVNNFSGVLDTFKGRKIDDDLSSVEVLKEDITAEEGPVEMELQKNKSNEIVDAWSKPKPIKVSFNKNNVEFSEDGIAVKLNADMEARNSQILKNSVVIKVLGNNVPFSVCSTELRKQWRRFGGFHLTSIGMDWILCSFQSSEVVDEVLNGGPWYVNEFIIGMDKWSTAFDPNMFKGISAPVWVRFPCLPLYCWDEDNIASIASFLGTPIVGHNKEICPENVSIGIQNQSLKEKEVGKEIGEKNVQEIKSSVTKSEYGPWIHVHFKDIIYNRGNIVSKGLNDAKLDKSFKEDNSRKNNAKVDRESMVNKKDIVEINDVLASDSRDVRKSIGKENSVTAVTNRFAVLSEDPEEAGLVEQVNDIKNTEQDKECIGDEINHSELVVSSAAVKVKLAKELKSLGPVNVENKKKKRFDRLNPKSGERSITPF
ncbi:hypothetical protein KFK09_026332 [Dendrobium nobile]|uniref:DUF4283 domain-containing protein n=1 Tax=Dendrobium nobile TaxID=94219 RepID=A0A8T3A6H2_DENNO|nr:hypothetical protein KFK09_026332 [Dendrobium nobile]